MGGDIDTDEVPGKFLKDSHHTGTWWSWDRSPHDSMPLMLSMS